MVRSGVVTVRVDWIRGSWTCSPAPQPKAGSKPASGSEVGGMTTVTAALSGEGFRVWPPHPARRESANRETSQAYRFIQSSLKFRIASSNTAR